jgi:hypothetical protein
MMQTRPVPASGSLDFGRGFGFVFQDPDWIKKVLIGGAFALLGILLVGVFFVAGYALRVLQRTARDEPQPLPEWDDLGGIFADGLKVVGLNLAYSLVLALAMGCPLGLLLVVATRLGPDGGEGAAALMMLLGLAMCGLLFILSLALGVYLPAALVRMALLGRFGAGFELAQNVAFIRRNLVNYLLALVIALAASLVSQLGFLLLCVGIFPAAFWSYCVAAWAMAEVARRDPAFQ